MSIRHEQAAIIRCIGERMKEARVLCSLNQSQAAKRLGYANPSKLSKVETASARNTVPLWLIVRAAKAYDVSIDYLMGASNDWEVGARMTRGRETASWLFDTWEKIRRRDIESLYILCKKSEAIEQIVISMLQASRKAQHAMQRFSEKNPGFEDMPAGSPLLASITEISHAADYADSLIKRYRIECELAANDTHQLSLEI